MVIEGAWYDESREIALQFVNHLTRKRTFRLMDDDSREILWMAIVLKVLYFTMGNVLKVAKINFWIFFVFGERVHLLWLCF